jgi:hypothetical protein
MARITKQLLSVMGLSGASRPESQGEIKHGANDFSGSCRIGSCFYDHNYGEVIFPGSDFS